jgi:hypothetical protein
MGSLTVPSALPEATVHSIPSKTSYSGPARVRSYFQPAVDTEQQKLQAAQVQRARARLARAALSALLWDTNSAPRQCRLHEHTIGIST